MFINLKMSDKYMGENDFDIIILSGQSNCVGYGKGNTPFEPSENVKLMFRKEEGRRFKSIFQGKREFQINNADKRLSKFTGFYLYFGQEYEEKLMKSGRKLLFLRSAVGGTGFVDNRWGLNDDLYSDSIETAKRLLDVNPNNKIVGILWHQGETDVLGGSTEEYYYDKLKALVEGYRRELNMEQLPFIAGDMAQEWAMTQPNYINIKNATLRVLNEVGTSGYVESDGLKGNPGDDCIHFSSEANVIFGKRYFEKFREVAQKNKS